MKKAAKVLAMAVLAGVMIGDADLRASAADETASTPQSTWRASFEAGKDAAAKGDSKLALEKLNAALAVAEKSSDEQGIAEISNQIANVYLAQGDIENAASYAKRAKDTALKILMADPRTRGLALQMTANEENGAVWINHMMKAQFALDRKDLKVAEDQYKAAIEKAKEYAPEGMPMSSSLAGLGRVLVEQGKYAEAEPVLRQAITLAEKNWTPVTRNSALDAADAMDRLAIVLEKTGRKDEAEKVSARSKAVRESKSLKSPATAGGAEVCPPATTK